MDALAPPQLDARALEEILTEVGRQLLAGRSLAGLAPWGAATVSVEVSAASAREVVAAGACRLGVCGPDPARLGDLASHIDHTLLKADATAADVDKLCAEALEHGFASVCINGTWVRRCAEILMGSKVLVCTVVGFPLGASASEVKAYEARRAIEDGACEADMVLNVGALKSGDHGYVQRDIAMVAETCHRLGARLKVILETCLLTRE